MHQFRQARVVASKGGEAHTRMSASDIAKSCFANAASALLKSAWEKKETDVRFMSPSRQGSKTTRKDKKNTLAIVFWFSSPLIVIVIVIVIVVVVVVLPTWSTPLPNHSTALNPTRSVVIAYRARDNEHIEKNGVWKGDIYIYI